MYIYFGEKKVSVSKKNSIKWHCCKMWLCPPFLCICQYTTLVHTHFTYLGGGALITCFHYYQSTTNIIEKIKKALDSTVDLAYDNFRQICNTNRDFYFFDNNVVYRSIMGADDQALSYVKILTITSGWNMI